MEDLDVCAGETPRFAVVVEGKPIPDILWFKVFVRFGSQIQIQILQKHVFGKSLQKTVSRMTSCWQRTAITHLCMMKMNVPWWS